MSPTTVLLYWIPLGAGGSPLVRMSGRIYETAQAIARRRPPMQLYHTALEVTVDGVRTYVECAWPSPDSDYAARGVVVEGPVGARWLRRFRSFRYEVRRWTDGCIADLEQAQAATPVTADAELAARILSLVATVPPLRWGKDELGTGDMWNSNSVISYVLTAGGVDLVACTPPPGGRAPGWESGAAAARRWPSRIDPGPMTPADGQ